MTRVLELDPEHPQKDALELAASIIVGGGLVAFPTETVYGLGADAMNEDAVRKIYVAKGRPADNPCIVHVDSRAMLDRVACRVSPIADRLIQEFWPGPLTLVLERSPEVAPSVSAGLSTVAARMPASRIALELNSAAVIFAHNHPSGTAEPSRADEFLTQSLKSALQLVDVRVLDHLVVGRGQVVSFAERGLL